MLDQSLPPQAFEHGWIYHDAAFAQSAIVKSGRYEVDWKDVTAVVRLLSRPAWAGETWRTGNVASTRPVQ